MTLTMHIHQTALDQKSTHRHKNHLFSEYGMKLIKKFSHAKLKKGQTHLNGGHFFRGHHTAKDVKMITLTNIKTLAGPRLAVGA